jgi:hypothetical protein
MGHTSCKDDLMAYAMYILIIFGVRAGVPDPGEGYPRRGPPHRRHRRALPGRRQLRVSQGPTLRS